MTNHTFKPTVYGVASFVEMVKWPRVRVGGRKKSNMSRPRPSGHLDMDPFVFNAQASKILQDVCSLTR